MLGCVKCLLPIIGIPLADRQLNSLVASYDRDIYCSCSSLLYLSPALWGILCLMPIA